MENLVFTQLSVDEVRKMLREEIKGVLTEVNPIQEPQEENTYLNIQQVSELINLAVPTIYGLVHRRRIPFIKRGKKLLFEKKQLTEWLQKARKKTVTDIQKDADDYLSKD
jgi:excisionase family DNA binding protein